MRHLAARVYAPVCASAAVDLDGMANNPLKTCSIVCCTLGWFGCTCQPA